MNDTDAYILRYNIFSHVGGDQVMSDCHQIHDNIFEYWNFETDGSGHGRYPLLRERNCREALPT